ncbi:MAG: hypothetical protein J0L82_19260 [Deltaproteobacteria bacterium]|jgi:hypothetical protein|nr:hypothetical protein [Deltaproteobacteria bacterium]
MGMNDAKKKVVQSLKDGKVQAVERPDIKEKNLLKTGVISPEEVIKIISSTRGPNYRSEPHKDVAETSVHIFEPEYKGENWHIKCYFLEPDCWFISVHKSHVTRGKRWTSTKKATNRRRSAGTVRR